MKNFILRITKIILVLIYITLIMPVFGCNNEEIELVLCENECDYYEDGKCCGYVEYGYKFDKACNLVKKSIYTDGYLYGWTDYSYSDDGVLLEQSTYNFNKELTSSEKYDSNGNEISHEEYLNGKLNRYKYTEYDDLGNAVYVKNYAYKSYYSIKKEYDDLGNLVKLLETDYVKDEDPYAEEKDRTVNQYFEMIYDDKGIEISQTITTGDGSIKYRYEFGKDPGTENKYYQYDGEGNIIAWEQNEYDDNGNQTKALRYVVTADEITWHYEYEYDENGNKTVEKDFENEVLSKVTYYNENGGVIKIDLYDESGNVIEPENATSPDLYGYEYDEKGREIKSWRIDSFGKQYYTLYTYDDDLDEIVKYENYYDGHLTGYTEIKYKKVKIHSGRSYNFNFKKLNKNVVIR